MSRHQRSTAMAMGMSLKKIGERFSAGLGFKRQEIKHSPLAVVFLSVLGIAALQPAMADDPKDPPAHFVSKHGKLPPLALNITFTDLTSEKLSLEAQDFAKQLGIVSQLQRIDELHSIEKSSSNGKLTPELKEELRDLKQEISETVEETRLEILYVQAEMAAEEALQNEILETYTRIQNEKIFRNNVWSFRTNGALWALGEALSIPTWSRPKYSISSGTIGILAGVVPTAFSMVALRESKGISFERKSHPNMLSKIFDFPIEDRTDFPKTVWGYLHSVPPDSKAGKTRIDLLIDQWTSDSNLQVFTNRNSREQLKTITGNTTQRLSTEIISDRLNMITHLDAVVGLMNRPLLEIMMVVRGTKHVRTS